MKILLLVLLTASLVTAAFLAGRRMGPVPSHDTVPAPSITDNPARRLRFYQSPMHPWITSAEPGNCTICGMKLVPVYEGDAGSSPAPGTVQLPANSVSAVGIATRPVPRRPLVRTLRLAGTLDDNDARHRVLSATVEGRIEAIHVHHPGAEVRAGAVLADVYSPVLLTAAREHVALAGSGAAPALLENSAVRLRQLGLTAAQVAELPMTFKPDQRTLPWMAPMDGVVVRRIAFAGQWVREGEPLFELADFSVMWVQLDAYEADLPWLKPGTEVVLATPSLPGLLLTNRITFIDPNLDPMTRVSRVRVEVPNPLVDGVRRLRHKAFVEGHARMELPAALVVPRSAVLNPGGVASAWVERAPGHYESRTLRLGRATDDGFEILEGLAEGEPVVVHGGLLLDAQSQLQGGVASPSMDSTDSTSPPPSPAVAAPAWTPGTDAARRVLMDFLRAAADAANALASDDLGAFNQSLAPLGRATGALRALETEGPPPGLPVSPPLNATDLPSARRAFHQLCTPWVPTALALRGKPGAEGLRLLKCPMTAKAFPGAPPTATWWQWQAPVRNPWFGKDMLDCGALLP